MKVSDITLAKEMASAKGKDFDELPYWKQLTFEVAAHSVLKMIENIKNRGDDGIDSIQGGDDGTA